MALRTTELESCSLIDSLGGFGFIATGIAQPGNDWIIAYTSYIPFPAAITPGVVRINPANGITFYRGDFAQNQNVQAMACDYNGLVYAAGDALSTYDPVTEAFADLGSLPPGMTAGGGLAYRDGRLYLTTSNNELAEIDIDNPGNSTVLASFPPDIPLIQSLFTYPYRCDSIVTYAVGTDSSGSTLYRLDFEDYSLTELCLFERFHMSASTEMECILPPCEIFVDLDEDDSSGVPDRGFRRISCAAPVPVSDFDVEVFSPFPLDSIRLQLTGILDAGAEYLSYSGSGQVAAQGNNSNNLLLVNQDDARESDFEEALRNSLYHNDANTPSLGPREVVVSMYSSFYSSVPSVATIVIDSNAIISLVADVINESCEDSQDGSASLSATGGIAPYTFLWEDGQLQEQRNGLAAGEYAITITDNLGCQDTATLQVRRVDSLIAGISSNTTFACGNTASLIGQAQGGTPPYAFSWSPGLPGDTLAGIGAGTYQLLATDANGCTASASFTLAGADSLFTTQEVPLCQDETFEWQGLPYTSDTTLCQAYTS
ncbi:MAG: SprB repeat-containing protein, partial [Phaeodactylibacter sp.]|nr:SprB repeat-containing protein [Phaeodactylibacter sp.]